MHETLDGETMAEGSYIPSTSSDAMMYKVVAL
jgi:hypothetical protein